MSAFRSFTLTRRESAPPKSWARRFSCARTGSGRAAGRASSREVRMRWRIVFDMIFPLSVRLSPAGFARKGAFCRGKYGMGGGDASWDAFRKYTFLISELDQARH